MACRCKFRRKILASNINYIPQRTIYLDYNATTPVDPKTLGAFEKMCRQEWGNPSSLHSCGARVWDSIEKMKESIADYFICDPEGIHFCSSGSEAIHAGAYGILMREKERVIITTEAEHSSIIHPIKYLKKFKIKNYLLRVDQNGTMDLETLKKLLVKHKKTILLFSPVNHETGAIQPIAKISEIAKQYDSIIFFDAVQAAARIPAKQWTKHCDMFCISGHKLYATKGIALLYIRPGIRPHAFRYGGHQSNGLFPGTENTPGIASLTAAIDLMKENFNQELSRLKTVSEEGLKILEDSGIEFILESPEDRVPGVLCISLPWVKDIEKLLYELNNNYICISRFSACTSRISGSSQVLKAMGVPQQRRTTSLRISLGRWTKRDDFFKLASVIKNYSE